MSLFKRKVKRQSKREFCKEYLMARAIGRPTNLCARDALLEAEKAWDILENMRRSND